MDCRLLNAGQNEINGMRKVIIVDDHPLVLAALTKLISYSFSDIEVVIAESAAAMRNALDQHARPGNGNEVALAFVDLNLPDANGEDLLHELRYYYGIPTIAVSSDASHERIGACIRNGASGFVEKTSGLSVFPAAMNAVLSGGQYFPMDLIAGQGLQARQAAGAYLTPRQQDVLDLLCAGKSNKVIAASLGLTEGTVKNHVGALLQVFKVNSRLQLILAATKIGYQTSRVGTSPAATVPDKNKS